MKSVILVDAMNLTYRAHFAHQYLSSRGRPTGAIHGFLNNILRLAKEYPKIPMVFCWDTGGKTWRHDLAPNVYKANRKRSGETASDIAKQLPVIQDFLQEFGFVQLKMHLWEADDVIAFMAKECEKQKYSRVLIYSGDRDFYQCITRVTGVLKADKGKLTEVTPKMVYEEFGVFPEGYANLRALAGDASDNYKPIPKVGPKKALAFLNAGVVPAISQFNDLSKNVRHAFPQLKPFWSEVHLCYKLCKLPATPFLEVTDVQQRYLMRAVTTPQRMFFDKDLVRSFFFKFTDDYELAEMHRRREEFWQLI